jgi:hypothetical protein
MCLCVLTHRVERCGCGCVCACVRGWSAQAADTLCTPGSAAHSHTHDDADSMWRLRGGRPPLTDRYCCVGALCCCCRWCVTYKSGTSIGRNGCFGRIHPDIIQPTVVTRPEPHNLQVRRARVLVSGPVPLLCVASGWLSCECTCQRLR